MPADQAPSLQDLARAAVEAWRKWCDADRDYTAPEFADVAAALVALENRLEAPPGAGAYMIPVRVQVELRFACALLVHGYPTDDRECQAVIDKARRLTRLLLDGNDAGTPAAVRKDDEIRSVVTDLREHRDTARPYDCTFVESIPYAHRAAATAELAKGFGLWWDSWIEPKLRKIEGMLTPTAR